MDEVLGRIEVDVNAITRSIMPPASWYIDPKILELEQDRIFRRTWQWVGDIDQVAAPGAYFTCEVAGEPLIVVRADNGALRAFSNVCLHRGALIAEGAGTVTQFRCRYHQWTYGLDGSLRGTPFFERRLGDESGLPQVHVDRWGPLVFINLDPQPRPLMETLGDLPQRFAHYRLEDLKCAHKVMLKAACNWKVHQENARECYHCPSIHRSFAAAYEVESSEVELFDMYSVLTVNQRCGVLPPAAGQDSLVTLAKDVVGFRRRSPARRGLQGRDQTCYYYLHIFPTLTVILTPDHVVVSKTSPDGVEGITMERAWFFEANGQPETEVVQTNVEFRLRNVQEDLAICEVVQKGLRSRYRKSNRYSPKEVALHHFHSLLRRFLWPDGTDARGQ